MRFSWLATVLCAGSMVFQAERFTSLRGEEADESLHALLDEAWEYRLEESPLFASNVGDHRANDRLDQVGVDQEQRRAARAREFLEQLEAIDREALSTADRINYDMLARSLRDALSEHEFGSYLIPITNREGFHIDFPRVAQEAPFNSVQDYENFISRLRGFSDYTDQHIELMRAGMQQGMVLPEISLRDYEAILRPHIDTPAQQSDFYDPFGKFPDRITDADRARLREAGKAAIDDSIRPAYRRFLEFIRDEYLPATRDQIGASALPNGREFYRHRVRHFTTLDTTPEAVHETGLAEVTRIRQEMHEVMEQAEFRGTLEEFVAFLRTDPQFYAKTPEELMMHTAVALKKMDGELPSLFGKLPRTPYGIKEVPAFIAPQTTAAYYNPPAGDGTRAGFYYVNTYALDSRPLYAVEALSLHEAVPGHHLQLALQQELESLPPFRRFSNVTAFIEGWGLYSERLGLEAGFYEDPYSNFGRLSYEAWRACRLVVDTGIHYFGWTRQRAIEFMEQNTALSRHNIVSEVDRYIAWPGQALAYKMGELKIRELRALAERELGPKFDVRQFHDAVLRNGAVPLAVLEDEIKAFIEEQQ